MPATMTTPNSASLPQPDMAGPPAGGANGAKPNPHSSGGMTPPGKPGGTIMLSRSEAAALTALETDDPKHAMKRASDESGLDVNQVRKLQARARRARSAGFTLQGGTLKLAPTNHAGDAPEDQGLLRPSTKSGKSEGDEEETTAKPKAGAKAKVKTKVTTREALVTARRKDRAAREAEFEATIEKIKSQALESNINGLPMPKGKKKKINIGKAKAIAAPFRRVPGGF
jgi:hypothetical protein